jgi:Flp pilus assembly protein TadD
VKFPKTLTATLILAAASSMFGSKLYAETHSYTQAGVLRHAEHALQRGHPDATLALLEDRIATLSRDSMRAEGLALICKAHFQNGDYLAAEQACDKAVNTAGNNSKWSYLNNRGVMRLLLGRLDSAQADFQQAIRRNPISRDVHRNMSVVKRLQREDAEASANSLLSAL